VTDNRTLFVELENKDSGADITTEDLLDYFESHGPLLKDPFVTDKGKWGVVFVEAADQAGLMRWVKCSAAGGMVTISGQKVLVQSLADKIKAESSTPLAVTGGGD
jgi:hypothetical protein